MDYAAQPRPSAGNGGKRSSKKASKRSSGERDRDRSAPVAVAANHQLGGRSEDAYRQQLHADAPSESKAASGARPGGGSKAARRGSGSGSSSGGGNGAVGGGKTRPGSSAGRPGSAMSRSVIGTIGNERSQQQGAGGGMTRLGQEGYGQASRPSPAAAPPTAAAAHPPEEEVQDDYGDDDFEAYEDDDFEAEEEPVPMQASPSKQKVSTSAFATTANGGGDTGGVGEGRRASSSAAPSPEEIRSLQASLQAENIAAKERMVRPRSPAAEPKMAEAATRPSRGAKGAKSSRSGAKASSRRGEKGGETRSSFAMSDAKALAKALQSHDPRSRRLKSILSSISLEVDKSVLFSQPCVSAYDMYQRRLRCTGGTAPVAQVSTQTGQDDRSVEVQTEEVRKRNVEVQFHLGSDDTALENLMASIRAKRRGMAVVGPGGGRGEGKAGEEDEDGAMLKGNVAGEDSDGDGSGWAGGTGGSRSSRRRRAAGGGGVEEVSTGLSRFLLSAGAVMEVLCEENLAREKRGGRGGLFEDGGRGGGGGGGGGGADERSIAGDGLFAADRQYQEIGARARSNGSTTSDSRDGSGCTSGAGSKHPFWQLLGPSWSWRVSATAFSTAQTSLLATAYHRRSGLAGRRGGWGGGQGGDGVRGEGKGGEEEGDDDTVIWQQLVIQQGGEGVMFPGRDVVAVWSTVDPMGEPSKVLVGEGSITCLALGISHAHIVVAGTAEGSVLLWDLRESWARHMGREATEMGMGCGIRAPTYSTAAGHSGGGLAGAAGAAAAASESRNGHTSAVVQVVPVPTLAQAAAAATAATAAGGSAIASHVSGAGAEGSSTTTSSSSSTGSSSSSIGGKLSVGSSASFQLASLDDRGLVVIWISDEASHGVESGSIADLGLGLGGRIRLLPVRAICLSAPRWSTLGKAAKQRMVQRASFGAGISGSGNDNDQPSGSGIGGGGGRGGEAIGGPRATCMAVCRSDPNRFVVGLTDGSLAHESRLGKVPSPSVFRCPQTKTTRGSSSSSSSSSSPSSSSSSPAAVTAVSFSPFSLGHFLAGCSDGSVRLYHEGTARPLTVWEGFTSSISSTSSPSSSSSLCKSLLLAGVDGAVAVSAVEWSSHRPAVFFVSDANDRLHAFDLLQDDRWPVQQSSASCNDRTQTHEGGGPGRSELGGGEGKDQGDSYGEEDEEEEEGSALSRCSLALSSEKLVAGARPSVLTSCGQPGRGVSLRSLSSALFRPPRPPSSGPREGEGGGGMVPLAREVLQFGAWLEAIL